MLPDFFLTYTEYFQPLNLFKYITFRSIGALLTALLISFIFGSKIITLLKAKKFGNSYQDLLKDSFFREKLCLKKNIIKI